MAHSGVASGGPARRNRATRFAGARLSSDVWWVLHGSAALLELMHYVAFGPVGCTAAEEVHTVMRLKPVNTA